MGMFTTQNHEQKTLTTAQITTLQVPAGGKIQSCALAFFTGAGALVTEAQIRAELTNIRLTLNGQDVVNASPIQILDLYEAMGVRVESPAAVAGVLELNIGRLLFVDPVLKDIFGYGTADVSSIQVQITAGTLSAIASVQTITERSPVNENLGTYCRYINYAVSFNATGDNTLDTLPRDTDSAYLALMINDGASGTITHGEVRVNSSTIRERLNIGVNDLFNSNKGYAQPAGYFVHSFADGTLRGQLPMLGVTDLRFVTTFSVAPGAGGYTVAALTGINMPVVGSN